MDGLYEHYDIAEFERVKAFVRMPSPNICVLLIVAVPSMDGTAR